ncbi:sulfotransferase domain-containing protein [Niveispirillum lacus]|nr:sulfotransferase domain-containing protein [Niveispirillum lacus]
MRLRGGGFCWIASYPKSGNTWMRLALAGLLAGGARHDFARPLAFAPFAADRAEVERALDLESSDFTMAECADLRALAAVELAREAEATLYRRVHEAWEYTPSGRALFPPEATLASLYMVRDPRDVAVSYAHHTGIPVDAAILALGDPANTWAIRPGGIGAAFPQHLSTWSGHVESWLAATPTPLVLRYEDMRDDPAGCLAQVAAHLRIAASDAVITATVAATRFDVLRQGEAERGFFNGQVAGQAFFRRGVAGAWRDELTRDQVARIERDHGAVMSRMGYL